MIEIDEYGDYFIGQYNHGVKVGGFTWYYNPIEEGDPSNYLYDCDGTKIESLDVSEGIEPYFYPLDIFTKMGLTYVDEPYGIPLPFKTNSEVYDVNGLCVLNTCQCCFRSLLRPELDTCDNPEDSTKNQSKGRCDGQKKHRKR